MALSSSKLSIRFSPSEINSMVSLPGQLTLTQLIQKVIQLETILYDGCMQNQQIRKQKEKLDQKLLERKAKVSEIMNKRMKMKEGGAILKRHGRYRSQPMINKFKMPQTASSSQSQLPFFQCGSPIKPGMIKINSPVRTLNIRSPRQTGIVKNTSTKRQDWRSVEEIWNEEDEINENQQRMSKYMDSAKVSFKKKDSKHASKKSYLNGLD